jgi:DNA (cytosine-5)-methyltransferase 1
MRSIEICAGAGGQALGLEQAGFHHAALVEIDTDACATLRKNRPQWNVIEGDIKKFSAVNYYDIDLLAGGMPCPPFSIAGKQLGNEDDRDLFPEALRLVRECSPKAVMLENVRGLFSKKFDIYRDKIISELNEMGYECTWELIQSYNYGVSQMRSRSLLIALKTKYFSHFTLPAGSIISAPTVGQLLYDEMASKGWEHAEDWAKQANGIAPTLVGGSKKHGGADLGPTRAKDAWKKLSVDGRGIADIPPVKGFAGMPKLTVKMAALVQGFPIDWEFTGKKTPAYRQVGNAFPPPVARIISRAVRKALIDGEKYNFERKAAYYG